MILDVSSGFPYYISLVGTADYKQLFLSQENLKLLSSVTPAQAEHRYAPGKWSIKQIVGHMTDHERIMTYRTLRISRRDTTPLPGYDQELFVNNSRFNELNYIDVLEDFQNVRQATISLMNSFSPEQLQLRGTVWKSELTVEEALKATIGHEIHHIGVIKERYLK
ncbi:MAG TPA: DinB family protein [Candidatus Acidoferrales bacterium]|nr:DinB family protein [Candidatus Acidoferrales bacterium]